MHRHIAFPSPSAYRAPIKRSRPNVAGYVASTINSTTDVDAPIELSTTKVAQTTGDRRRGWCSHPSRVPELQRLERGARSHIGLGCRHSHLTSSVSRRLR